MNKSAQPPDGSSVYDIVIVGGGAGGLGAAASLFARRPNLSIAVIEPRDQHFYQPGWTMVGGGIFSFKSTERRMADLMPRKATWIKKAAASFAPERNEVILENGATVKYSVLVASPGIKLDWEKVKGLKETLGKNGVTSNYKEGLAPYTWELVKGLNSGAAIFTQPPMPIKCAGAPQKAMYLSCDHWRRQGRLNNIEVRFCNAGAVLFGVADYVPALMEYVKRYNIHLDFGENLVAVDGEARIATFERKSADGKAETVNRQFDMLHVCPPQTAPDFVRNSPLANAAGWIDVDQATLQHPKYPNIFALGDAMSAPNAKTAAAVRKQAPIVAVNALAVLDRQKPVAAYDGYGSCPLTVERGKIVLAEFGYGGKLLPTFPMWLNDGLKPTRRAWFLKERLLPMVYWRFLLKGRELFAEPSVKT
jgi:sulfide:quinone oxidoreductase